MKDYTAYGESELIEAIERLEGENDYLNEKVQQLENDIKAEKEVLQETRDARRFDTRGNPRG